jgi:glycosyltransferase involved in cell wall biosynthesis
MFTTFYPPYHFGGDAVGVQRLARALVRHGHRVTVAHDVDAFRALGGARNPAPAADDGVEVLPLRSGTGMLSPLLTHQLGRPLLNERRIRALLAREPWDATVFHNVSLVGGPWLLDHGRGVTLYEAHEHWLVCPTHVLWRHKRELCTSRQCLRCMARYFRPPQIWRSMGALERRLAQVDAFIAKSRFSRDKHHEFGFPRPMEIIPYFLPDVPPVVRDERPPHPRSYFLFVGRLERIKGLDDVIPLFEGTDGPDLLVAGDGDHAAALRAQAAGRPRVRFLGRLPQEGLAPYYRNALALVVPSVCFETFGIILIEAFSHGTPVIARRVGPFPEIVEQAGAGLLFEGADELRTALRAFANSPELRARLGAQGRAAVEELWSEAAVVPQYLALIQEAAGRKSRQRAEPQPTNGDLKCAF